MDAKKFDEVKAAIKKRLGEVRALGIKGEKVHHMVRTAVDTCKIKQIEKDLMHAEKNLEKLEDDIKNHFVSHAETEEEKIIMEIVAGMAYCYIIIRNDALFEKVHFAVANIFYETFWKGGNFHVLSPMSKY